MRYFCNVIMPKRLNCSQSWKRKGLSGDVTCVCGCSSHITNQENRRKHLQSPKNTTKDWQSAVLKPNVENTNATRSWHRSGLTSSIHQYGHSSISTNHLKSKHNAIQFDIILPYKTRQDKPTQYNTTLQYNKIKFWLQSFTSLSPTHSWSNHPFMQAGVFPLYAVVFPSRLAGRSLMAATLMSTKHKMPAAKEWI